MATKVIILQLLVIIFIIYYFIQFTPILKSIIKRNRNTALGKVQKSLEDQRYPVGWWE